MNMCAKMHDRNPSTKQRHYNSKPHYYGKRNTIMTRMVTMMITTATTVRTEQGRIHKLSMREDGVYEQRSSVGRVHRHSSVEYYVLLHT